MNQDSSTESMKDWPAGLKLSAARDALAKAIYEARCLAFSFPAMWDSLDTATRDDYRAVALRLLEGRRPTPRPAVNYFKVAVEGAREHARVIGEIGPDTPWGTEEER